MKTKLLVAALVVAGLAGSTFAADAKTKHHKASDTTTGMSSGNKATNMNKGAAQSPQGDVGPGTNNNQSPAPSGTK